MAIFTHKIMIKVNNLQQKHQNNYNKVLKIKEIIILQKLTNIIPKSNNQHKLIKISTKLKTNFKVTIYNKIRPYLN